MPSLAEMLMGYLPSGASPVFGTTTPQEQAMVPPTGLDQAVGGAINSMATLPQRAIQNSQFALNTGVYDPAVPLEAAMTTMGATPFGSGMAGTSPIFGAGPIKAYHGSPHDFEKFDLSKIGTGEGAQAYGHGLYFAENEGVAKSYRETLARQQNLANAQSGIDKDALKYVDAHGGVDQARAAIEAEMAGYKPGTTSQGYLQALSDFLKPPNPGRMYEVNINADPAHFLDWDKPLSEQHPTVQAAIQNSGIVQKDIGQPGSAIARYAAGDPVSSSVALREAGIPGIKYLDQGSRLPRSVADLEGRIAKANEQLATWNKLPNDRTQPMMVKSLNDELADLHGQLAQAKATPQTSNYVVFNDKLIDILRKYGLAGAAATGAMSPAYGPQQPNLTAQALMEGS